MSKNIDMLWGNMARYLTHLRGERRLARNTIEAYAADIKSFISHLEEEALLGNELPLAPETIRTYAGKLGALHHGTLKSKRPAKLAASSQERRLVGLKGYLKFLFSKGLTNEDLSQFIDLPRKPKLLPVHLSRKEMERVLDSITGGDFKALRNLAIIETIYATGCRVSEIVGLDLDHIDLTGGSARVMGKGGKERIVILGRFAQRAIRRLLILRAEKNISTEEALFTNRSGRRLSVRTIQRLVKNAGFAADLPTEITPHALRHSFATHMLSGGADLRTIQELLGHSSMSTVQKYTHLNMQRIKDIHSKAHPLGDG